MSRPITESVPAPIHNQASTRDATRANASLANLIVQVSDDLAGLTVQELEDGMTADLGEKLLAMIQTSGDEGVKALASIIASGKVSAEILSHTLRWLARIDDHKTYDARLRLLTDCLRSSSHIIRDGALLGLSTLGDRRTIDAIRSAAACETRVSLKRDMEEVLNQL